jgi:hypothetical protein
MEFTNEEININVAELVWILNYLGYSKTEFCEFIGKSPAYLENCLRPRNLIPFRITRRFIEMVGEQEYVIALKRLGHYSQRDREIDDKKTQKEELEKVISEKKEEIEKLSDEILDLREEKKKYLS